MARLHELNKSKPRGNADENIISEISRLESSITVTRDDLVSLMPSYVILFWFADEFAKSACKLRLTGLKDELKHVEKELKKTMPELKKACLIVFMWFYSC